MHTLSVSVTFLVDLSFCPVNLQKLARGWLTVSMGRLSPAVFAFIAVVFTVKLGGRLPNVTGPLSVIIL